MGWYQKTLRCIFQQDFKQNFRIKSKDGAAVRLQVTDSGQGGVDSAHRVKIRCIQNIVHLANFAAPFVNRTYLRTEYKTNIRGIRLDAGRQDGYQFFK